MKISLIGSGWLAQPLAKQLQVDGHELILTSTQQDKVSALKDQGFNALQYELGDQLSEPALLFDTDVLIIAITSKDTEAYDVLIDQLRSWDQLSEHACKHLLFISSTSVYQNDDKPHNENSQNLKQENPLLAIEQLIQSHHSASIIRLAGLVGPKRHPGKFFTDGRILKNPNAPVNLIHLDDCIGIIKALIDQAAWNQVFNGCADTHPTKLEFYGLMAKQLGVNLLVKETDPIGSNKTIDNHKVKMRLNYELIHPDVMSMRFNNPKKTIEINPNGFF